MKKISSFIIVAVAVIGLGIWLVNTPQNITEIKVGAILPLTGKEALVGESMKNGLDLAIKEINKAGGISGKPFRIIYEDSVSDAAKAITAYQKLTQVDKVTSVFTTLSAVTLGIAPLAEKDKVLNLNVGSASVNISMAGDYTFRYNVLPQDDARALADFIYTKMQMKEIPMLVVNADSGITYSKEFRKDYEALGGKITGVEMYEKGATNYKTQLIKIKAVKPKGIMTVSYGAEMGIQFRQARDMGLDVQWFTTYTAEDPQTIVSGGEAANGLIYTHYYDVNSTNPIFGQFKNNYKSIYGAPPGPYAALIYDYMNILAVTMLQCDSAYNSTCVKDNLYKVQNYPGVAGAVSFDTNGDTRKEIMMKTIKAGEFVKY
jgi:branched-chain amino acid transport system substrate-binding protein